MKRISIISVGIALAAVILSLTVKPTRWAAKAAWYAVSHPLDSECGYYDLFALVVRANENELGSTPGGAMTVALVETDSAQKVQKLSDATHKYPSEIYISALLACQPIDPKDQTRNTTLLRQIKKGQTDEPDNAYFDLCEWALYYREHNRKQAEAAIVRGSAKTQYDDHQQNAQEAGQETILKLSGKNEYFNEELRWRTSAAIVLKLPEKQPNESSTSFLKKRLTCAQIIDLVGQQPSQGQNAVKVLGHLKSMLVAEGGSSKMSNDDALSLAKKYDDQARAIRVNTSGFSFAKAVQEQIQRSELSKPALRNDEAGSSLYNRCSSALSAAAALSLSIPTALLFLLGQRLRQHPSAAISLPLAALAPITFAFSRLNEYSTIQLSCLLLGAVFAWLPPARKWLWLLALPFVGAAAACWVQYGDTISLAYKPDELILNCVIVGIGLAICFPKVQLWLAWVLSLGVVGGVLYWLSSAWSIEGTFSLFNNNLAILCSIGVLALLGPRAKVSAQMLLSVVLLSATATYIGAVWLFANAV